MEKSATDNNLLQFHGAWWFALLPFLVFLGGVITVALSGAPDERGFWPFLLLALAVGLLLAKNKTRYAEAVLSGMSEKIVMIMITAWILASCIGVLMTSTGFVEALIWLAAQLNLGGVGYIVVALIICCIVSLSTGSSFATILICGPILYPAGGLLGSHLPTLAGAIIGGATFGDFFAPISDTTISSALSQNAPIGPTVKSRLKYILPATLLAVLAYTANAYFLAPSTLTNGESLQGDPSGLPMLLVPAYIIFLFLRGRHLLHGLLQGLLVGTILGFVLGLLPVDRIFSLDLDNFGAKSFIIDGINRSVGISFFTILLMGLVGTIKASGLMDRLVALATSRSKTAVQAEGWIAATVGAAVLLTTHSIVAILMVADFAKETGEARELSPIRRSNILSMVVCFFPFYLPYFIPVILMANTTQSGAEFGIPAVTVLEAGLYNFVALFLFLISIVSITLGYGRRRDQGL